VAHNFGLIQRYKNLEPFAKFAMIMVVLMGVSIGLGVYYQRWEPIGGLTAIILLGTLLLNAFQIRELQRQRESFQKPLVTPHGRGTFIMPVVKHEGYTVEVEVDPKIQLCIKNVGAGPASSISILIQKRAEDKPAKTVGSPVASVPPLGSGDESFVYHFGKTGHFSVAEEMWLVISYDDIFGNHFKTECQWSGVAWHNFITQPITR